MTWRVPGVFGAAIGGKKSVPTLYPRMEPAPTVYPPKPMARTLPCMADYGHKSRFFGGYRWAAMIRYGKDHSLHTGEVVGSIPTAPTIFQRVIGSCRQ